MNWKKQRYPRKTYNARSELTSARRTKNGQPIPGFSEDFDYDPIGNRRSSSTYNERGEAQTSTYEANNLNQYTSRTTPGYAAVRGEADPNATVTVNENPTFRLGSYYFGSDLFDNTASSGFANLETYATLAQTAANGEETEDLVSSTTNQVYLAQSSETFAYDEDGNQTLITTKTGLWRVTYNGENRPILWERDSDNTTLTMSYDHMGRRREKDVQRFFYDGHLQIANFHSPTPTQNSNCYIWDCTETIATRPLVWTKNDISSYYDFDGNKNVSEAIAADGSMAAHYEYAPFGAITTQCGTSAATTPWRYSCEYAEDDTGTVYYNYRHYEAVAGRWLNRDQIEEEGGVNLYVGCDNNHIERFDRLGLTKYWDNYLNYDDHNDSADVWEKVGGGLFWNFLTDNNYDNSCALRVSRSLILSGHDPVAKGTERYKNNDFKATHDASKRNKSVKKGDLIKAESGGKRYAIVARNVGRLLDECIPWAKKTTWSSMDEARKMAKCIKEENGEAFFADDGHAGMIKKDYDDPYFPLRSSGTFWRVE